MYYLHGYSVSMPDRLVLPPSLSQALPHQADVTYVLLRPTTQSLICDSNCLLASASASANGTQQQNGGGGGSNGAATAAQGCSNSDTRAKVEGELAAAQVR